MSTPISVTEGRVTVTANDTEENIRASAAFTEPAETKSAPEDDAEPEPAVKAESDERNPDGTFKAKAPETPKSDGDPRKSHQAKINQAIAKQREAERRAEEAERRAAEREAELQSLRAPKAAPAVATPQPPPAPSARASYLEEITRYQAHPDAPKLDDFVAANLEDPYASFQAAMAVFVADQRLAEREERVRLESAHKERTSKVLAAEDLAEQKHPGFRAMYDADTRVYPPAVLNLLAEETVRDPDTSAELLHHLLTNPQDAEELARLEHPIAAARKLERILIGLSSASSGPETTPATTNAKPLIKPVRPSIQAHTTAPEDLEFGPRYIEAMNEKERKAATRA